jgi:threonylcarbamoyladenosine tRNA methylthiotransferase MtaB
MTKRLLSLVPNLPRLRLSSIDVAEVDNTLLQLILYEKRLMPHFHISLQSGDNMILKRMKRRHNRNQVIDFCNLVRKYRKDVAFGADIIAGFPTETEEMFTNSLNLIKESKIQYIHAFPYSERDGTPAARMPQVKQHLRKERTKALIEQGKIELSEFSKKYVGQTVSALVEKNNVGVMENFLKIYISENVPQNNIENIYISDFVDNKLIGKIVR